MWSKVIRYYRYGASRDTLRSLIGQLTTKPPSQLTKVYCQLAEFKNEMTLADISSIMKHKPSHSTLCGNILAQTCTVAEHDHSQEVVAILDQAIMPGLEVPLETLKQANALIEMQPLTDASTSAHIVSIMGKLHVFGVVASRERLEKVSLAVKESLGLMSNEELGQVAIGMGLCGLDTQSVWEALDTEALKRATHLPYYDHLRIATGFGFLGLGSEQFWRTFVDHLMSSVREFTPDILTQSMLTLSQCQRGQPKVYAKLEKRYLQDYDSYDASNRVSVFASFARVQEGSELLWSRFADAFEELMGSQRPEDLGQLTLEFLKVHPILPNWVVERLARMNVALAPQMSECTAQAVLDALEKSNLK